MRRVRKRIIRALPKTALVACAICVLRFLVIPAFLYGEAKFCEQKEEYQRAYNLYLRAGNFRQAVKSAETVEPLIEYENHYNAAQAALAAAETTASEEETEKESTNTDVSTHIDTALAELQAAGTYRDSADQFAALIAGIESGAQESIEALNFAEARQQIESIEPYTDTAALTTQLEEKQNYLTWDWEFVQFRLLGRIYTEGTTAFKRLKGSGYYPTPVFTAGTDGTWSLDFRSESYAGTWTRYGDETLTDFEGIAWPAAYNLRTTSEAEPTAGETTANTHTASLDEQRYLHIYLANGSSTTDVIFAATQTRRNRKPYIGMPEEDINTTELGTAKRLTTAKITTKTESTTRNTYAYYNSDGNVICFIAAVSGKVKQVEDYRSAPITESELGRRQKIYSLIKDGDTSSGSKSGSSKSGSSKSGNSKSGSSKSSGSKSGSSKSNSSKSRDPDDYDIDGFYEDYRDLYDSYEEAYEDFLDNLDDYADDY